MSQIPAKTQTIDVKLGDTEQIMLDKMQAIGARDVTNKTKAEFYHAIVGEQKYYWWELDDRTIVAVLLAGDTEEDLQVAVIEIGEPGKGVSGIENWRSQKLKSYSSIQK